MKKVVLLLLAVIFCYTTFAAGDSVSAKVVNVSSSLNIREQPSKQSSVVGKIGRGETVQVLTLTNGEGTPYYIDNDGKTQWLQKQGDTGLWRDDKGNLIDENGYRHL